MNQQALQPVITRRFALLAARTFKRTFAKGLWHSCPVQIMEESKKIIWLVFACDEVLPSLCASCWGSLVLSDIHYL